MLDVLTASGAHLELRPRWVSTSLAAHAIVITLAVAASQRGLDAPMTVQERTILLVAPKASPAPPPPEVKRAAAPRTLVAEPPPKGFQTVATLQDIPTVIPPVDLTQRPLDPRDFTGRGVEGGVADGVVGGIGKVGSSAEVQDAIYEATTSDARFEQATLVSEPAPRYPPLLETVGIEGRVALEFVVDTFGRVEPASIRVLHSSHVAFDKEARATVGGAVFRPARFTDHAVRQLTRQSIRFVMSR